MKDAIPTPTPRWTPGRCLRVAAAIAVTGLQAPPAYADYLYTYTGTLFSETDTEIDYQDNGQGWTTFDEDVQVLASVHSPALLGAGAGLGTRGLSFTLVRVAPLMPRSLDSQSYPMPAPDPACPQASDCPSVTTVFDIAAVDTMGLPAAWNISIDYEYRAPTGRLQWEVIGTSTISGDVTNGGQEGFYDFAGTQTGSPGRWALTVVPEPAALALWTLGALLVGMAACVNRPGLLQARPALA